MSDQTAGNYRGKWRRRWLTIAVLVLLGAVVLYFLLEPVRKAKRFETALNERFGPAETFTPATDGHVEPERIMRFIRVREALQTHCRDYQEVLDNVLKLEEMESQPELDEKEKASRGVKGLGKVFHAIPSMVEFMEARNLALLKEEMGMGEYLYLYFAAYGQRLAGSESSAYANMDDAHVSRRARATFIRILRNQLDAAQTSGAVDASSSIREIEAEIRALKQGDHESPWPRGPGGKTRDSLDQWSNRLDELYCDGMVRLELQQKNQGLNFDG